MSERPRGANGARVSLVLLRLSFLGLVSLGVSGCFTRMYLESWRSREVQSVKRVLQREREVLIEVEYDTGETHFAHVDLTTAENPPSKYPWGAFVTARLSSSGYAAETEGRGAALADFVPLRIMEEDDHRSRPFATYGAGDSCLSIYETDGWYMVFLPSSVPIDWGRGSSYCRAMVVPLTILADIVTAPLQVPLGYHWGRPRSRSTERLEELREDALRPTGQPRKNQ